MSITRGWTTSITTNAGQGDFYCPVCANSSRYTIRRVSRCFSFMAVPLFKIGVRGDYIRCQTCKTLFQGEILRLSRDQVEKAAAAWTCPSCYRDNSFRALSCKYCQAPRPTRPVVPTTPSGPPPLPGKTPPQISLAAGLDPWLVITTPPAIVIPTWRVIATNIFRACVIFMGVLAIGTGGHVDEALDRIFGNVGETEFKAADALIDNSQAHEEANGNTPAAQGLAGRLAMQLSAEARTVLGTHDTESIDTNAGKFLVFCQLNSDSCVFLIKVPNFSLIDDKMEDAMARFSYGQARQAMAQSGAKNISHVIVSLRSWATYKITLEGNDPPDTQPKVDELEPMHTYTSGAPGLYPYFAPHPAEKSPANAAAPANPSTSPTTPVPSTPKPPQESPPPATPAPDSSAAPAPPTPSTPPAPPAEPASPASAAPPVAERPDSKPREMPAWVPIYPGLSRVPRGPATRANGVLKGRATFETADSLDQVKSFYQAKLKEAGFEVVETTLPARLFEKTQIDARNDHTKNSLHAEITQMKNRTFVTLKYEGPEDEGAGSNEAK